MSAADVMSNGSHPAVRTVAVTGSSGFVGSWTMQRLTSEPNVRAVPFFEEGQADITDVDLVNERMRVIRPDALIHLAAIAAPAQAQADARQALAVNLTGTLNLAQAMRIHAPGARFIFAGSSESYGASFAAGNGRVNEDAPLAPKTLYGLTKASADMLLGQMAEDGLDVVRFRPFNHTGPGQSDAYVVAAFARQIARAEAGLQTPVIHVGNLDAERDFLDVRDVVEAYVAAAVRIEPLQAGCTLNLASGQGRSIRQVLADLLAASERNIEVRPDSARMRASEIARAVGDPSRALAELGWRTKIDWSRTIGETLDFWRRTIV